MELTSVYQPAHFLLSFSIILTALYRTLVGHRSFRYSLVSCNRACRNVTQTTGYLFVGPSDVPV